MPRFTRLTPDTAVGASRELLGDLVSRHGTVGDMVSTMANSPAVLESYLAFSGALGHSSISAKLRQSPSGGT